MRFHHDSLFILNFEKIMKKTFLVLILVITLFIAFGQSPVSADWKQNFKTSLNSVNKAIAVEIDRHGNAFVTGLTWIPDSSKDIVLIKYAPDGKELWRRIYDDPQHGDDIPYAMCIDKFDNIWITGMAKITPTNTDFLVVKFSPEGIPEGRMFDGKDHLFDCGMTITTDDAGNAFAGGYITSSDSGINMQLYKLNPNLELMWSVGYTSLNMDIATRLLVDDSSNVYVAGNLNVAAHSSDMFLMKFDPTGKMKWQFIYDGSMHENDAASFLASDDSMNIYMAGFANHSNSRSDIATLKFNRNGVMLQENIYYGKISDNTVLSLSAYDHHVCITGNAIDYNINEVSTFYLVYDKGGKELYSMKNPVDVRFIRYFEAEGQPLVIGTMVTHPESTLIPYIASPDTLSEMKWEYVDSTVFGVSHIIKIRIRGNEVYFLGDDAGNATGTITLMKYSINIPKPERKRPEPLRKNKSIRSR